MVYYHITGNTAYWWWRVWYHVPIFDNGALPVAVRGCYHSGDDLIVVMVSSGWCATTRFATSIRLKNACVLRGVLRHCSTTLNDAGTVPFMMHHHYHHGLDLLVTDWNLRRHVLYVYNQML